MSVTHDWYRRNLHISGLSRMLERITVHHDGEKVAFVPDRKRPVYAFYRGEKLIGTGTADELAELTGCQRNTILFYASKSNQRRASRRKNAPIAYRIDREDT